jgi:PEP-CTERM motif
MSRSSWALGAAMLAAFASPASATVFDFKLTGTDSASFRIDTSKQPDSFTLANPAFNFGRFEYDNVSGTFNGVAGIAASISFAEGPFLSPFQITGSSLGFAQFIGPVVYSGSTSDPQFLTGSFHFTNPFFRKDDTLTISAVGGVPEPSTWAMIILGFGGMGLLSLRHRSRRALATA